MDVKIGMSASYKKSFGDKEVAIFADISADNNPIHLDEEYAAQSIFRKRVVHGVLVASMFSKIFGTILPGEGGIYLSQSLKFMKPVYIDQVITATVTLLEFDTNRNRGLFKTVCTNDPDELVLVGEAQILFPDAA